MRISTICASSYQKNNQSFGMAIKAEKQVIKRIENKLSSKATKKFAEIIEAQKTNPVDVTLNFVDRIKGSQYTLKTLQATVNGKTYNDSCSIIDSELKVVEEAIKYADEQNKLKNAITKSLRCE